MGKNRPTMQKMKTVLKQKHKKSPFGSGSLSSEVGEVLLYLILEYILLKYSYYVSFFLIIYVIHICTNSFN